MVISDELQSIIFTEFSNFATTSERVCDWLSKHWNFLESSSILETNCSEDYYGYLILFDIFGLFVFDISHIYAHRKSDIFKVSERHWKQIGVHSIYQTRANHLLICRNDFKANKNQSFQLKVIMASVVTWSLRKQVNGPTLAKIFWNFLHYQGFLYKMKKRLHRNFVTESSGLWIFEIHCKLLSRFFLDVFIHCRLYGI